MNLTPVNELRRIAEAVEHLRHRTVEDVSIRSDCRQLKIKLDDGEILLVSVLLDENGKPRLDVDLVRLVEAPPARQLEVHLEGA